MPFDLTTQSLLLFRFFFFFFSRSYFTSLPLQLSCVQLFATVFYFRLLHPPLLLPRHLSWSFRAPLLSLYYFSTFATPFLPSYVIASHTLIYGIHFTRHSTGSFSLFTFSPDARTIQLSMCFLFGNKNREQHKRKENT